MIALILNKVSNAIWKVCREPKNDNEKRKAENSHLSLDEYLNYNFMFQAYGKVSKKWLLVGV